MGCYIIKIKDLYFEWSTVVDAPVSEGMTRKAFEDYYTYEYGQRGMDGLQKRLDRADKYGTSALTKFNLSSIEMYNRAGKGEKRLTLEQIYQKYQAKVE